MKQDAIESTGAVGLPIRKRCCPRESRATIPSRRTSNETASRRRRRDGRACVVVAESLGVGTGLGRGLPGGGLAQRGGRERAFGQLDQGGQRPEPDRQRGDSGRSCRPRRGPSSAPATAARWRRRPPPAGRPPHRPSPARRPGDRPRRREAAGSRRSNPEECRGSRRRRRPARRRRGRRPEGRSVPSRAASGQYAPATVAWAQVGR